MDADGRAGRSSHRGPSAFHLWPLVRNAGGLGGRPPAAVISFRPMDSLANAHPYPGKLIVVEGIDGSGKSTQLQLAMRYLKSRGLPVAYTEWNSADLVKAVTKKGKKKMTLTPMTF